LSVTSLCLQKLTPRISPASSRLVAAHDQACNKTFCPFWARLQRDNVCKIQISAYSRHGCGAFSNLQPKIFSPILGLHAALFQPANSNISLAVSRRNCSVVSLQKSQTSLPIRGAVAVRNQTCNSKFRSPILGRQAA
jgi:hypothetical protein